MDQLQEARKIIDRVDREIAQLFVTRMKASEMVASHKKENGLPIDDLGREAQIIEQVSQNVPELYRPYYVDMQQNMMRVSKKYQKLLMHDMSVAYSGVEGAFAHLATRRIFPEAVPVAFPDFESAYNAVVEGVCNCAVLPIENSYAGDVSQVMDLAYRGQLSVSGVYELPLSQSLLALPGTDITDIREVQSHPQALSQCMPYLKEHGWILTQAVNTAVAAKNVAESGRRDLAVVASEEAAKLYGLRVLSSSINESKNNTTRFLVFSAAECKVNPTDNHFILFFNVKNEPGSLGRAVSLIGQYHFNLRNLKSFPTGQENWSYYFYTEGEGNLSTPKGQLMMEELKSVCSRVKILGSFPDVKTI